MKLIEAKEKLCHAIRRQHYSEKTLESYVGWLERFFRWCAKQQKAGVEFDDPEALVLFDRMRGCARMMGELQFGAGLRLREVVGLRIKDVRFAEGTVVVKQRARGLRRIIDQAWDCGHEKGLANGKALEAKRAAEEVRKNPFGGLF